MLLPGRVNSSSGEVTVNRATAAQDKEPGGKIVARLDFDPKPNGFGFPNYGDEGDSSEDLGAADLIDLFGVEGVCESGDTAENCQLTEPAQAWIDSQLKSMDSGHCEGMAAVSLRFFEGKEFRGKGKPSDFQGGAASVFDLKLQGSLRNYIAYYFVTQAVEEVFGPTTEISQKRPSEILDLLIRHLRDGKPTALGIYNLKQGRRVDGHSVTPFAVEEMGGDVYRVHIYDNNDPGETKYLTVNKKAETWNYRATTRPGEPEEDYEGDANTHTLEITPESLRDAAPFTCPFCSGADSSSGEEKHHASRSARRRTQYVGFSMTGEGDMLITDASGKRVGFDFKNRKFVDEISGSNVIFEKGGLGKNIPPQINLPLSNSSKPYTIALSGKSLKRGVAADVDIEGPGFVVGFNDINLDPGESLTMTATPDGREISFTASNDGQTPDIFITIESGRKHPTYLFEIERLKLSAGKTVTMRLDIAREKLFFKDNDAGKNNYDVLVERINPDGSEDVYEHDGLNMATKADNYEMDFSDWDGKGEICFEEDDEGNGFEDSDCVKEPNEAKPGKQKNPMASNSLFRMIIASLSLRRSR